MKIGDKLKEEKIKSKWSHQESDLGFVHFDIILLHRQGHVLAIGLWDRQL